MTKLSELLSDDDGWRALAQSVKERPDLEVAKADVRFMFKGAFAADQIDEAIKKLETFIQEVK